MDRLKKKGDSAGLNRTQPAYLKFLTALWPRASRARPTTRSSGPARTCSRSATPRRPQGVFDRILKTYEKDEKFLAVAGSGDRILRTRLKLAAALRGEQKVTRRPSL